MSTSDPTMALLSAAVNCAIDSVLITTADVEVPVIVYVNPAFTKMTGYTAAEVIGRTPRFLQGPRTDRKVLDRLKACLKSGEVFNGRSYNYRKDGSEFFNEWHIEPIYSPTGMITHFLAIQRDITERMLMEKTMMQTQKMESMWLMAGGIAHDFNNILSVVQGYGVMAMGKLNPDQPGYRELKSIIAASDKGADLTRRLLRFSRQEENVFRKLNLNILVADTVMLLGRLFPKNIGIKSNLDPAQPEIEADAGQIEQILINSAINARDAMPEGGALTISTLRLTLDKARLLNGQEIKPGDYVRMDVSDTGQGMSEETKTRLFQPFFTTKEIGKGTGLGLSIMRSVLTQHRGAVEVKSEFGAGTTFSFFLPVRHDPLPDLEVSTNERPMSATSSN